MATQGEQLVENRYELEGLRERYASVEIYDAHDRQLDRRVSLQVLAVPAGGVPPENEEFVKEFVARQCAASSVYHCQILAVYDAGEWRGRPYSVMEKLGERTALSMQAEGALDLDGALRITRQAAEALQCCRGEGLHTWTFAPQAVRIDDEGNARLAIIEGLGGRAGPPPPYAPRGAGG
jgi:eukaryotic-like serine/threonine-protein kinase